MFAMINGVLNYSVVSSARNSREHVDLNSVLKDVRNDLELLILEKHASFSYGSLPTVHADDDLIHQLFYNLINNSLKFARSGEPAEIRISWRPLSVQQVPFAEIAITDNGIGFSNEHAEQIFGTFVRLHSKDQYEGTGLGLALCKRIIERYGGSIAAEGKSGVGCTFIFTLPI